MSSPDEKKAKGSPKSPDKAQGKDAPKEQTNIGRKLKGILSEILEE